MSAGQKPYYSPHLRKKEATRNLPFPPATPLVSPNLTPSDSSPPQRRRSLPHRLYFGYPLFRGFFSLTKGEGLAIIEILMTMSQETKEHLKTIPKTRCSSCNTPRNYSNPMTVCFWCNKKFCFDHITCGYLRKNQPENEELHDICDQCLAKNLGVKYA